MERTREIKSAHEERPITTWNGFVVLGIGLALIPFGIWMVSNLMTVLCAESEVQPVINTGTLYH